MTSVCVVSMTNTVDTGRATVRSVHVALVAARYSLIISITGSSHFSRPASTCLLVHHPCCQAGLLLYSLLFYGLLFQLLLLSNCALFHQMMLLLLINLHLLLLRICRLLWLLRWNHGYCLLLLLLHHAIRHLGRFLNTTIDWSNF